MEGDRSRTCGYLFIISAKKKQEGFNELAKPGWNFMGISEFKYHNLII